MNKAKVKAKRLQDIFLFHLAIYRPVKIPNGNRVKNEKSSKNIGISFRAYNHKTPNPFANINTKQTGPIC